MTDFTNLMMMTNTMTTEQEENSMMELMIEKLQDTKEMIENTIFTAEQTIEEIETKPEFVSAEYEDIEYREYEDDLYKLETLERLCDTMNNRMKEVNNLIANIQQDIKVWHL